MAYEPPTSPRYTNYLMYFGDAVSTEEDPERRVSFEVRVDLVSAPEADAQAAFQRLVTLVANSPEFTDPTATRSGMVSQVVTPI